MAAGCQFAFVDILNWSFIAHFFQKIHLWTTFIKLLFMSECEFCLMNNNEDCRQNRYPFSLQGIMRGPLLESDCSSWSLNLHKVLYMYT